MPLDWADYWRDTGHLTGLEHGGYLNLLGAYWTAGGPLPADEDRLRRLARLTKPEWKKARPAIVEFFNVEDGFWIQKRVQLELEKAGQIYERRKAKIQEINDLRSRPSSQSSSTVTDDGDRVRQPSPPLPLPLPTESVDRPEIPTTTEPSTDFSSSGDDAAKVSKAVLDRDFVRFWATFPRKVAKLAARKAFEAAVKKAPVETILLGASAYASDPNRKPEFTAHPATWLNAGRWSDEPIPGQSNGRVGSAGHRPEPDSGLARFLRRNLGADGEPELPTGGRVDPPVSGMAPPGPRVRPGPINGFGPGAIDLEPDAETGAYRVARGTPGDDEVES